MNAERLRNWSRCAALVVALALAFYTISGGKFTAEAARRTLVGLAIAVVFGVPAMFTFRHMVCWAAAATRLPGWGAVAVGLVLTFSTVVGLALVTPPKIGVPSLTLALMGGVFGSLEALDRVRDRQSHPSKAT